eukprot:6092062-Pyramimonas_sp.AAC.1
MPAWRSSTRRWTCGCVMPPPVLRRPGRVWQLHEALCGARPASRLWQACVGDVFEKSQPPW